MLALVKVAPQEFQSLLLTPGNDIALAALIRGYGWDHGDHNSFVFWYHAQHDDPGLRNNQFGIEQTNFRDWFNELCGGSAAEAQRMLDKFLYWKRVNERRRRNEQ
jgi:hypothetical protein